MRFCTDCGCSRLWGVLGFSRVLLIPCHFYLMASLYNSGATENATFQSPRLMFCVTIARWAGQDVSKRGPYLTFYVFPVVPGLRLALVGFGESCDEELVDWWGWLMVRWVDG